MATGDVKRTEGLARDIQCGRVHPSCQKSYAGNISYYFSFDKKTSGNKSEGEIR